MEKTLRILMRHLSVYPKMQIQDAAKLLYQNEFGPGHMIADFDMSLTRLRAELETLPATPAGPAYTDIGGGLCRLELRALRGRLSPETLCRMFTVTADAPRGHLEGLQKKLALLYKLPFPAAEVDAFLSDYTAGGCPALHHSPAYRAAYHPAYRVALAEYGQYLDLFSAIDRQCARGHALVAIDGRCAAGKTTLADITARVFQCPVIHMDDFFLPAEKRTPARYAQPGGNVDWERFEAEVLIPLDRGEDAVFRPFSCHAMAFGAPVTVPFSPLIVVEGSYSLHPTLREYYTLRVFLSVSPAEQLRRIAARDGAESVPLFRDRWIPLEEAYFSAAAPAACADIVYAGD